LCCTERALTYRVRVSCTCAHHPLHHLRQKAYGWYFTPIKEWGRASPSLSPCSAEAKAKGCPTWTSKQCFEEQQLLAWFWRSAAKEWQLTPEDGACVQQIQKASGSLAAGSEG